MENYNREDEEMVDEENINKNLNNIEEDKIMND